MLLFFCALCISLFEMIGQDPSRPVITQINSPQSVSQPPSSDPNSSKLLALAQKKFELQWLKQDDSWFIQELKGQFTWQLLGLESTLEPLPLSTEDTTQGFTFKGLVRYHWKAQRVHVSSQGWTHWIEGSFVHYELTCKSGTWELRPTALPHWYSPDMFVKPTQEDITRLRQSPVFVKKASDQILSELRFHKLAIAESSLNPDAFSTERDTHVKNKSQMDLPVDEKFPSKLIGKAILRVEFRADGTIGDIKVVSSLNGGLDENAVEAARKIKFRPAMKGGQPVTFWSKVEFSFNLLDEPKTP